MPLPGMPFQGGNGEYRKWTIPKMSLLFAYETFSSYYLQKYIDYADILIIL